MTPEPNQSGSVLIGEERKSTTTPTLPTLAVDGDGGGELIQALTDRGVVLTNAQALVACFPAGQVKDAVAYFDGLSGAGPGLLVLAVREGRRPERRQLQSGSGCSWAAWRDRTEGWRDWLAEHMPEVQAAGEPLHLGAFQALWPHSPEPSALSVAEHGGAIRAAVAYWESAYGSAHA